jgi:hypothetical protein
MVDRDRTLAPARRLLAREVRPLARVREDPELLSAVDQAVRAGQVDRIARLGPRQKRLLLEILDERAARRPMSDPAALVRVTSLLLPSALAAGREGRAASGPAR